MEAKQVLKINPITFTSYVYNKNFFTAIIQLLLVFYASGIAPALPPPALNFMSMTIPRIVIYSIILILAAYSPVTAIFASICIVVTMQSIQKLSMEEKLMSIVKYKNENKTRENCTCFCSDEELNEALEKHLEKKRNENIRDKNINEHTNNDNDNDNSQIISFDQTQQQQENKKQKYNTQEHDHDIPENISQENINNYHMTNFNDDNDSHLGYEQNKLYHSVNFNDNTNKKQVSFSEHIFEEHLFNNPSPMITPENGPKAFNSEGNKYMNLNDQETIQETTQEKNINPHILTSEMEHHNNNIDHVSHNDISHNNISHNDISHIVPSHNIPSHNVPIHIDVNEKDKKIFDEYNEKSSFNNTHTNNHVDEYMVKPLDSTKASNNITGYVHNDDFAIF